MTDHPASQLIHVSSDLFFETRLSSVVQGTDWEWVTASTILGAESLFDPQHRQIFIIELGSENYERLVELCQGAPVRRHELWGYAPHVHQTRIQAARDLGFNRVVSRGQILSQLEEFIASNPPFGSG